MKIVCTAIALILSFVCNAQRRCVIFEDGYRPYKKTLHGHVKRIQSNAYGAQTYAEATDKFLTKSSYTVDSFNRKGFPIRIYQIKNDTIEWEEIINYKFDANGSIIAECYKWDESKTLQCQSFKYDSLGNIILQKVYDNDRLIRQISYEYNSDHFATKLDSLDGSVSKEEYKCMGNVTERTLYHPSGQTGNIRYIFDDKGNIISKEWIGAYHRLYKYDEHNNEIYSEQLGSNGQMLRPFTVDYIYDHHGNWTRCIDDSSDEFHGDLEPVYNLTIREIEYY